MNDFEMFAKRINELAAQKNVKQVQVAQDNNITKATISRYFNGKQLPNSKIASDLANYFGVSVDYLLGISDVKTNLNYLKMFTGVGALALDDYSSSELELILAVPIFKNIKFDDDLTIENDSVDDIMFLVKDKYKNYSNLFAKKISTDQMYPRIMKNDIILFETISLGIDKIYDGDLCLVSIGNNDAVVREMLVVENGLVFNPFNTDMPPKFYNTETIRRENINVIGRAIKLVHNFKDRSKKDE